jgi:CRISPR-associated protein Cmr4
MAKKVSALEFAKYWKKSKSKENKKMKKSIMYLFARTPVHVGAGNSVGAVDSPVMRERHTRIPIIPGSSLKGVLSDLWNEVEDGKIVRSAEGKALFGEDDMNQNAQAGTLLIGEARVLAFPVRSAKGMFAWITCPLVLNRYARDVGAEFDLPTVSGMNALAGSTLTSSLRKMILEEYVFDVSDEPSAALRDGLASIFDGDHVWSGIKEQLAVVSDEMFQHFCENACNVVTRIKIDDQTGVVVPGALFNLEEVPSETLFYTTVHSQCATATEKFSTKMETESVIQIGGDATTGLGFCSVKVTEVK